LTTGRGTKFYYVLTISVVSPDGMAYLSLETNRREFSTFPRIMRRRPQTEMSAVKRAKEFLAIAKGLVGSILEPMLRS
jgi:hypothetical protein